MIGKWIFGTAIGAFVGWEVKALWDDWREYKQLKKEGERLEKETDDLIETVTVDLEKCDPKFKEFCIRCYNKKNPDDAVQSSIELARYIGVPEEKIIHNIEELDKYFLD